MKTPAEVVIAVHTTTGSDTAVIEEYARAVRADERKQILNLIENADLFWQGDPALARLATTIRALPADPDPQSQGGDAPATPPRDKLRMPELPPVTAGAGGDAAAAGAQPTKAAPKVWACCMNCATGACKGRGCLCECHRSRGGRVAFAPSTGYGERHVCGPSCKDGCPESGRAAAGTLPAREFAEQFMWGKHNPEGLAVGLGLAEQAIRARDAQHSAEVETLRRERDEVRDEVKLARDASKSHQRMWKTAADERDQLKARLEAAERPSAAPAPDALRLAEEALAGLESRYEPGVFCDHAAAPCDRCDKAAAAIAALRAQAKPPEPAKPAPLEWQQTVGEPGWDYDGSEEHEDGGLRLCACPEQKPGEFHIAIVVSGPTLAAAKAAAEALVAAAREKGLIP